MKKRILSILLTLCMVLMLCPVTAFAEETHTATFKFDHGTLQLGDVSTTDSPYALPFTEEDGFTLGSITNCGDYIFLYWKCIDPDTGEYLGDYESGARIETYADIAFEAVYQEPSTLAITVNGFEVGNTPEDITLSFESTNLGVTFGKDDVALVTWNKYVEELGRWESIYDSEEFQADTRYQLYLELNNKGLSELPAVTINGKTPEFCKLSTDKREIRIDCEFGTPAAPTLAVTVDGFEVGNTPNDITFSFASTIPGIEFSEDDIQSFDWAKYHFIEYEAEYRWDYMLETEAFEAGVRYRIEMNLDNKGLNTAPAVTVNGKTPEYCTIATSNGVPIQLQIGCDLGTPPMPPLTIDGPDVVCAQQDYEFTVTPADGATLDEMFAHDPDDPGWDFPYYGYLTQDEDGVGHGVVPASEYGDADSTVLAVFGAAADGTFATVTKTVQISPEHIYVEGVCGCGAVQQYTVTYDGGEGSDPVTDVKTHGVDLTLRGETFTMDGFVQTGWVDKETGAAYRLGDTYTENADVTLTPVFEKIITLTVPYTTTVALGDVGVPGEKTFTLALIGDSAPDKDKSNVTITGSVTTNGKGSYNGTLTFTGTERTLWAMLSEGAFVQQVDAGEDGWTVDDTVWGVLMEEIPVAYAMGDDAAASGYTVYAVPASIDGNGYYYIDWENLQAADMTFTNTYTAHAYALKHDATHHWDECAGCKDVQNKELHKYGDWKVTKEATQTAVGEKEHTCTICGYTETAEIAKLPATTDPTKPDTETKSDTTSPQTGDNSNMALWIALLFVSGAGVIGTTVYGRKKRAK